MDFKGLFITMSLAGLIVFAMLSFAITFQNDNAVSTENSLTQNNYINSTYNELYGNLSSVQSTSESASSGFGNITPSQQYGELEITAIASPTKVFKSIIVGTYNVMIKLPMSLLGVPPVVASLISGILLLSIIIGIWAIWKGVVQG